MRLQYAYVVGNRVVGSPPAEVGLNDSTKQNTPIICRGTYARHAITIAMLAGCRMVHISSDSSPDCLVLSMLYLTRLSTLQVYKGFREEGRKKERMLVKSESEGSNRSCVQQSGYSPQSVWRTACQHHGKSP